MPARYEKTHDSKDVDVKAAAETTWVGDSTSENEPLDESDQGKDRRQLQGPRNLRLKLLCCVLAAFIRGKRLVDLGTSSGR